MYILPAIDILDGKPQMLYQGDYKKGKIVGDNALEIARSFEKAGATWLHMVDLNGAKEGKRINNGIIEDVVKNTNLKVEIGGGIRNLQAVDDYLSLGVSRCIIGSAAVKDPDFLKEAVNKYGEKIAVGIDVKDAYVYVNGWLESTEERYDDFLSKIIALGVRTVIVTDISKDGALEGANYALYEEIARDFDIDLIASGGVTDIEEVKELSGLDIYGCIIGSALYEGNIRLEEAIRLGEKMTRIIPCLDAKDGKVVKGINFENVKEVGSIEDLAAQYSKQGADEIVVLDITATSSGDESALDYLKKVKENSKIPVTMGGGIRSSKDVERVLGAGASKAMINSAAVKKPDLINEVIDGFGPEKIIIGIDSAWDEERKEYRVYIDAGQTDAGELIAWVKEIEDRGAREILVTSKDKDGTKSGFDLDMYQLISDNTGLEIIASGGAGKLADFAQVDKIKNVTGLLAASLFHYGEVSVGQLRSYLNLDFSKMDGLIPAMVVDNSNNKLLMQGFMNEEALEKTMDIGKVTFYSRSKKRLWTKGEESKNYLELVKIVADCDYDSLLIYANPAGPTCHTGEYSCFYNDIYGVE